MAFEISYSLETAEQFWEELDDMLSVPCSTDEEIDNLLRIFLGFTTRFREEFIVSEEDLARCAFKLRRSVVFGQHAEYVRRQFIYVLLQEDDPATLYIVSGFLLFDGRINDETFAMMQEEGTFPRLLELIQEWDTEKDAALHRKLIILLYEMARIQTLSWEDLASVTDEFILRLFTIIESISSDASDPYHYPVIRVILVLNEQYMVTHAAPTDSTTPRSPSSMTNRVLKVLSTNALQYKTFGENIILLLNRESETIQQLHILKLLYLLFDRPATAEYFYTNDLHVLLDVIIRNLLDLPADGDVNAGDATAPLRHMYLRVLQKLLENSQLRRPGMAYKRAEICQVLRIVSGASSASNGANGSAANEDDPESVASLASSWHFAPVDETTVRLAERCRAVSWLEDPEMEEKAAASGSGHAEAARRSLGMSVHDAGESAESVLAVANHTEKPGVKTPSRGLNDFGK